MKLAGICNVMDEVYSLYNEQAVSFFHVNMLDELDDRLLEKYISNDGNGLGDQLSNVLGTTNDDLIDDLLGQYLSSEFVLYEMYDSFGCIDRTHKILDDGCVNRIDDNSVFAQIGYVTDCYNQLMDYYSIIYNDYFYFQTQLVEEKIGRQDEKD